MNLRVSTIVGISKFTQELNLEKLYQQIIIDKFIKFAELGTHYKGDIDKKNLKKREKGKKKYFYNQVTLHILIDYNESYKKVNIKLFNNGSIQMTGLKSIDLGKKTLSQLLKIVKTMDENVYDKQTEITLGEYSIALFNTDFDIGFKINRDRLNSYLLNMNIYTSFEPCIYPGVNIKYYYKSSNKNGKCECCPTCNGNGKDGSCKKITIAVFNSGKIIITGGRNYNQCYEAFQFISKILKEKKDQFIDN
jgi:TATA-box binding protein (TBP) (component of TFIID and TFIIIB)